jgi:uncharacterized phage protein (TIGR01671 family)
MRDIEFRGRKDNGEWVYGDLVHLSYGIITINDDIVDEKTVGQHTGFEDKSGVKIFEEDIVKGADSDGNTLIDFVRYDFGYFYLRNARSLLGQCLPRTLTVIGNIHDNPELLKEASNG